MFKVIISIISEEILESSSRWVLRDILEIIFGGIPGRLLGKPPERILEEILGEILSRFFASALDTIMKECVLKTVRKSLEELLMASLVEVLNEFGRISDTIVWNFLKFFEKLM